MVHKGETRTIIGREHADSGFVTLLAQDGVEGLQAKNLAGEWIDVPPANGTLAVNFGQLLERWTGGRVRATRHRVIAPKTGAVSRSRSSMNRASTPRSRPCRWAAPNPSSRFSMATISGSTATNFVEMSGVKHLRQPRRARAS